MSQLSLMERTRLRKEKEAAAAAWAVATSTPTPLPSRSSPSRSSSPPPSGFKSEMPNPFTSGSLLNIGANRSSMAQRKSMGDRILKKIKLDTDSRAEFNQFIETDKQEERDALQVAFTLRLSDMFVKSTQEAASTWTPSKSLEKALRPIIYALLLMPNIKYSSYSGNLTSILMTVAREAGIKQLPKEEDDSDALASWLNKEMNNAKYVIKKTINDSLTRGSTTRNIADLTYKLLTFHARHFNATLSLYFRVALIRSHIGQHDPKQFWAAIDEELDTQIYQGGPEAVVDNFKTLYEEDVNKHGNPADSKHTVSTDIIGEKRPKWYASLHANAPKVQRVKVRAAKRRREDSDDEKDDTGAHEEEVDGGGNHVTSEEEGGGPEDENDSDHESR